MPKTDVQKEAAKTTPSPRGRAVGLEIPTPREAVKDRHASSSRRRRVVTPYAKLQLAAEARARTAEKTATGIETVFDLS